MSSQNTETRRQPFTYPSLDGYDRRIRLVTLAAGAWKDPIRCTLNVVDYDVNPPYEALSYVWGNSSDFKDIQLNGQPFEVTENLWMVLRRLRRPEPRVLWIDAICIDQENHNEKSHQVSMMGEIYSRCKKAILWLGEDSSTAETGSTSTTAYDVCELLSVLASDKHFNELPCFSPGEGRPLEISAQYANAFCGLDLLLKSPWWKRIWVVQEMVRAPKIEFRYASERFSYETLRSVTQVLDTHATTCCKSLRMSLRAPAWDPLMIFEEQVEPMVHTRETWKRQAPTTLFDLRRRFSAYEATDKRDLFYALIGLVTTWGPTAPLNPNYEASLKDAIITAVFKCVLEHDGIGFLQGSRLFRNPATDMPTWIPDANFTSIPQHWVIVEKRRLRMASSFSACASFFQDASGLEMALDGALRLKSLMVDKIAKVGVVCQGGGDKERVLLPDTFRKWMEMVGIGAEDWPERPPGQGSLAETFWRTMLNNSVELDTNREPFYREANESDYHHLREVWAMVLSFKPFLETFDNRTCELAYEIFRRISPTMSYHLLCCLWQRRMIVTERGLIGLAPADVRHGDEVHILLGSPVPFFLRPFERGGHPESTPSYEVVGNGYVHDLMFGKAFEGESNENIHSITLR